VEEWSEFATVLAIVERIKPPPSSVSKMRSRTCNAWRVELRVRSTYAFFSVTRCVSTTFLNGLKSTFAFYPIPFTSIDVSANSTISELVGEGELAPNPMRQPITIYSTTPILQLPQLKLQLTLRTLTTYSTMALHTRARPKTVLRLLSNNHHIIYNLLQYREL